MGTSEMVSWVKVLTIKSDDLSLVLGTDVVEGELTPTSSSLTSTYTQKAHEYNQSINQSTKQPIDLSINKHLKKKVFKDKKLCLL